MQDEIFFWGGIWEITVGGKYDVKIVKKKKTNKNCNLEAVWAE